MTTGTAEYLNLEKEYKLARKMALWYLLGKKRTYKMVGEKFGMKSYEVSKYLTYYLPKASPWLNKHVRAKADAAKKRAQNNFKKK